MQKSFMAFVPFVDSLYIFNRTRTIVLEPGFFLSYHEEQGNYLERTGMSLLCRQSPLKWAGCTQSDQRCINNDHSKGNYKSS